MERRAVIVLLLALTLATSGCLQAVTGGTVTFEASPAHVNDQTLQESGYELEKRNTVTLDRTVPVPLLGKTDVRITNHVRAYSRVAVDSANETENEAGAMFVVSTPKAKILGKPVNPLGTVPLEQLVTRVAAGAGQFGDLERVGGTDITVLGSTTTVATFETTVEVKGKSVASNIYVTRVAHGSDYVIAVAVLPEVFSDDRSTIYELLRNIEHEG